MLSRRYLSRARKDVGAKPANFEKEYQCSRSPSASPPIQRGFWAKCNLAVFIKPLLKLGPSYFVELHPGRGLKGKQPIQAPSSVWGSTVKEKDQCDIQPGHKSGGQGLELPHCELGPCDNNE